MEIRYIELKTGYDDDGPAWVGKVKLSKSGRTVYFNDKAFRSCGGQGISGNYYDVETGEEYWISGVKRDGTDRHRAGSGRIIVQSSIVDEYLAVTGQFALRPSRYEIADIPEAYPIERVNRIGNEKLAPPTA